MKILVSDMRTPEEIILYEAVKNLLEDIISHIEGMLRTCLHDNGGKLVRVVSAIPFEYEEKINNQTRNIHHRVLIGYVDEFIKGSEVCSIDYMDEKGKIENIDFDTRNPEEIIKDVKWTIF